MTSLLQAIPIEQATLGSGSLMSREPDCSVYEYLIITNMVDVSAKTVEREKEREPV